ncbi:MAG: lysophospholipid acyltransferase family protein [Pseudomonadota bacterium]
MTGIGLQLLARALTAVRGLWVGNEPVDRPRIYYGNHTSNGDFVLIWTALPPDIRRKTRPVAALDYWFKTKIRKFIAESVINAVLINRVAETREENPVELMGQALSQGSSLIIFPEGLRNQTEEKALPFKTGLFHVLTENPEIEAVPCWIENLNRVLPKGTLLPIPLICTVTFGPPITLGQGEPKDVFLERARQGLLDMAAIHERPQR